MVERISAGEAFARALVANGIDTVFAIPGVQTYPIFDGLARQADAIRTVTPRHEQATAYMAYGYAASTGRVGAYSVVPGPGVLNASAALATAYANDAPVLCLTGQVPSDFLGRGRGALHEIPDQLGIMARLNKHAARVERPQDVPAAVNRALAAMLSGRPGPGYLEMCMDRLAAQAPVERAVAVEIPPPPAVDPDEIARAVAILKDCRRPVIMVGGGAQHARAEVRALAEVLGAPVTAFRSGRGVVAEDDPLGLSSAAAHELWPETDALIGIGSRCEMQYMRWGGGMMRLVDRPVPPPWLIRIDIDPTEMVRLKPHAGIVADAAEGARLLAEAIGRERAPEPDAADWIAGAKAAAARKIARVEPHISYLKVIRDVLPRDGFLVEELCQAGFVSYYGFPVYEPRTYVSSGYQGTLGFGFPTALGVKVANPDRAVISITGDGGFMFGVQDLATAVAERISLVTVLFNNGAFGNVRRDQKTLFYGRIIASELANPDFLKLAESFGVAGHRVHSPDALRPVLERALADDAPALIEVVVDPDSEVSPWEFIHPPVPGEQRSR